MDASSAIALRSLVDAYAVALDERDVDGFVSLFTVDAELAIHEAGATQPTRSYRGHDELREVMELVRIFSSTFHLVANHVVEPGTEGATGITYCSAHHLVEDGGPAHDVMMLIRYDDVYRQGLDGWQFAKRVTHRQWTVVVPAGRADLPAPASEKGMHRA
jgi:hypothetical protein